MKSLVEEIYEIIESLNLSIKNVELSKKFILISIDSVQNFIKSEINSFIDFPIIKNIFINVVIGEYLLLIKISKLENEISFDNAIQSIKEGDTSITYFENQNNTLESVSNYFLNKKKLLYRYRQIIW